MAAKRLFPVVEVVWGDAWSNSRWTPLEEVDPTPSPCVTVGFEVRSTKDGILVASTLSEKSVNGEFFIPRGMILRRKVLSK